MKVHLEFRFNLRSVLLDIFNRLLKKPVFECAFAHTTMLFFFFLVKNSMERVSVICKLAIKWCLLRLYSSWLCPFKQSMRRCSVLTTCTRCIVAADGLKINYREITILVSKILLIMDDSFHAAKWTFIRVFQKEACSSCFLLLLLQLK